MKKLHSIYSKKSIAKLLVFFLIINTFMFTEALSNQAEASPVINDMNISTTDKDVSVYGTGGTDGNGADLADKPFRYSIGNTQSEWVRDRNNLSIAETLTSGALSNTQVMNNSLVLGSTSGGLGTTLGTGLEGFTNRKVFSIDHTKVDSELTNFPATVYLNSTNFDFSKCKPDGSDIRFTDKDLNPLKFEKEEFTGGSSADSSLLNLYNLGDKCTSVTGGWSKLYNYGSGGLYAENADNIMFGDNSDNYSEMRVATNNKIDISGYSKLYCEIEVTKNIINGNDNGFGVALTNTRAGDIVRSAGYWGTSTANRQVFSVDISNLTGSYYLEMMSASANFGDEQIYGKVYKVWLEKNSSSGSSFESSNLYNLGDKCTSVTGGWSKLYNYGSGGLYAENADNIMFGDNSDSYSEMRVATANKIDISGYSKLYCEIEVTKNIINGNDNGFGVALTNTRAGDVVRSAGYWGASTANRQVFSVDISDLKGSYYLEMMSASANFGDEQIYGKVYKVWLEKETKKVSNSAAVFNVLIPKVSNQTDTEFYMWYGNPNAYNTSIESWQDQTGKQLTYNGNVKLVPNVAKSGKAAYFDGQGDYFSLPNNASDFNFLHQVGTTGKWTAEFYYLAVDFAQQHMLLDTCRGNSANSGAYITIDSDRSMQVYISNGKGAVSQTVLAFDAPAGTYPNDGMRHRLEFDYDQSLSNNNVKVYIDGILAAQGSKTSYAPSSSNCQIPWLGAYDVTGNPLTSKGYLFGVRLTNGRCRGGVVTPNLDLDGSDVVFCTNFDTIYDQNYAMVQHMGETLVDATGNGNNGTATGTTVVNTDYGKARSINSATDVITYPSPVLPIGDKTVLMNLFKRSIRSGNVSGNQVLLNTTYTPGTAEGTLFEYGNADNLVLYMSTTNTDVSYPLALTAVGVPLQTWKTVGFSYKNGTVANGAKLFADGSVLAQTTSLNQISQYSNLKMCGENRSGASTQSPDAIVGETRISNITRSDAWIKAESLSLKNQLLTINSYPSSGFRESDAYDVSGHINDSRVQWTQTTPTGTGITVESNVSLDGGSSWLGWKTCTNGAVIADLDGSKDTSNARLKLRQTLNSSSGAITPSLNSSLITINFSKYEYKIAADPNKEYTVKFEVKDANGSITQDSKQVYTKAQTPQFTVTDKTENSMDLAFSDYNPDNTEYQIMCDSLYVNSSGVLTSVPTWITLDHKKITVIGLNLGTMYQFTAKARNKAGEETDYANLIRTGTTGIPIPSGDSEITGSAINNSVMLSWKEISNSLSYELEMDGVIRNVGQKTTYIHKDLMTGTQHTYRVRGRNRSGFSEWSELIPITTTSNLPLIPANVLAKASDDTVTVYWDPAQDATSYTVEIEGTQITDVKKNSACLFGLQPETSYTYKVKSCNLVGDSEWTATGSITTHYLETPTITLEQTDSHEIKIGWDKVKGANSYKIALDSDENFKVLSDSDLDQFATSSAITYTHENLEAMKAHVYRIKAICSEGESAWSDSVTLETLPKRPATPGNFRGSASSDFITLMWDAVQDAIGYDIEVDGIIVENDKDTEYKYKGLNQYTPHTYRVRSVTDEIESSWSNMLTISTLGGVPDVPKNVVITNARGIATLNWDKTDGAQYYDVKVGDTVYGNIAANSFANRKIPLIASSASIYTETVYQVRACNDLGASEWSDHYINNAIRGEIEKGKELELALTASNIMDFSKYTMNVTYNEKALTVTDLCAYSVEKELGSGMVAGRDIEIVSFTPGHIVFRVNKVIDEGYLYTSIINNIRFNGNAAGKTTLTYTVQYSDN